MQKGEKIWTKIRNYIPLINKKKYNATRKMTERLEKEKMEVKIGVKSRSK